jgi:hypothetical protein
MNRRKALKTLAIVSGGAITLPQWMISCGVSDSTVHHTSFSVTEQQILASVADTIIPAGGSIGALSVGVDKFLQKLIDDCFQKDVQDNIKAQLKKLDELAKSTHKKSYTDCTQKERETLLLGLAASVTKSEQDFFELVKSETIRGFNTSQKVMTEYLGYKVVPGHYYGCVDLKSTNHA